MLHPKARSPSLHIFGRELCFSLIHIELKKQTHQLLNMDFPYFYYMLNVINCLNCACLY